MHNGTVLVLAGHFLSACCLAVVVIELLQICWDHGARQVASSEWSASIVNLIMLILLPCILRVLFNETISVISLSALWTSASISSSCLAFLLTVVLIVLETSFSGQWPVMVHSHSRCAGMGWAALVSQWRRSDIELPAHPILSQLLSLATTISHPSHPIPACVWMLHYTVRSLNLSSCCKSNAVIILANFQTRFF